MSLESTSAPVECPDPSFRQFIIDVSQPMTPSRLSNLRSAFSMLSSESSIEVLTVPFGRHRRPIKWDRTVDFSRFAQDHLAVVPGKFSLGAGLQVLNEYNSVKQRDDAFSVLVVFANDLPDWDLATRRLLDRYKKATFGSKPIVIPSPSKNLIIFVPMEPDFQLLQTSPLIRNMLDELVITSHCDSDLFCVVSLTESGFCDRKRSNKARRLIGFNKIRWITNVI